MSSVIPLFPSFPTTPQRVHACTPEQQVTGRGSLGTALQPIQQWQNKDGCFGTVRKEISTIGFDSEEKSICQK